MDVTNQGGQVVIGPSIKVYIEKKPAAMQVTQHVCPTPPPPSAPHPPTPFTKGSTKIYITKQPAVSTADSCGCGAIVIAGTGATRVFYNG